MSRAALMLRIKAGIAEAARELDAKSAAGICQWVGCDLPAARVPREVLFFGDTHCAEHARQAEIECLADDQDDDAASKGDGR